MRLHRSFPPIFHDIGAHRAVSFSYVDDGVHYIRRKFRMALDSEDVNVAWVGNGL